MNQCMLYLFRWCRLLLISALFFLCNGCGYKNNQSGTFYFSLSSSDKCVVVNIYDDHDSLIANIKTRASVLHSYDASWFNDNTIFVHSADIGDFAIFIDKNRCMSYGYSKIFEPISRCKFCVIENPSDIVHASEQNYNPPQTGFLVLPVVNDDALQPLWLERKAQGTYDDLGLFSIRIFCL